MPEDILALADAAWRGDVAVEDVHPLVDPLRAGAAGAEVAADTYFLPTLGNIAAFRTGDGLVLVDTGVFALASYHFERIRAWDAGRLHTAIFSHGHIDHVFGVGPFEAEARERNLPAPHVVAHEAVPSRFERYILTAGYNAIVNRRQFGLPDAFRWPTEYRYPDETYRDTLVLEAGGERFELHHARGETDDHTWTWVPYRRVLATGDLFIWATPNCGNPQKVQRYPREWAVALREMLALGAEVLLPGHGFPILGADRIRQALGDTAALLEHLHDRTVELMNAGATLDEIIHEVRAPPGLADRPYLRAVYDDPEFIVRNVWRLYGGWYDGNPARLKPPRDAEVAAEIAALAGGATRLAERARELSAERRVRLAAHLAELAGAVSDDAEVQQIRADVFERFADAEPSVMAKGIYRSAARASRARLGEDEPRGDTPDG